MNIQKMMQQAQVMQAKMEEELAAMKIEAAVGPHRVVMDAPPEAGGGDEAPSPAELLLSAIGA